MKKGMVKNSKLSLRAPKGRSNPLGLQGRLLRRFTPRNDKVLFSITSKNCRGAGVVEFILILPWVVGIVLALIAVAIWVLQGHLMHYASHKQARLLSLYQPDKAETESQSICPRPITTQAPLHFSLNGIQLDLSHQDKQDAWRQPEMDNPIPFCGEEGSYALCGR